MKNDLPRWVPIVVMLFCFQLPLILVSCTKHNRYEYTDEDHSEYLLRTAERELEAAEARIIELEKDLAIRRVLPPQPELGSFKKHGREVIRSIPDEDLRRWQNEYWRRRSQRYG